MVKVFQYLSHAVLFQCFLSFVIPFNRKICRNCKCGVEDHDVQLENEENKKVGKLFEDTKYTGLIAKLKRDGIPSYKGNQVTIYVVKSVTYEWAPPGVNQSLALQYMELLPPERRPIAGTAGADYRKKQMAKQLPDHDQDPDAYLRIHLINIRAVQILPRLC
uniref:PET domain-containing protein n=1 Tax=Sinocyclocheilus grahami TaxID=75366 RepID=A0A672SK60_SINGR